MTSVTCLWPLGGSSHTTHLVSFYGAMWHHLMAPCGIMPSVKCPPTSRVSKNMKSQLSRNLTKFDWVATFCKTIQTVKSVSSFEIYKITSFSICYSDKITVLPILTKIKFLAFSQVLHKVSITIFKVLQS